MAAAGPRGKAEEYLRNTLADCAAFRSWTGTTNNQAAARNRIHYDTLPLPDDKDEFRPDELQRLRPYAIVSHKREDDGHHLEQISTHHFSSSGVIEMVFEQDIPEDAEFNAAQFQQRFKNTMDTIASELWALTHPAAAGYLALTDITMVGNPQEARLSEEQRIGRCLQQQMEVHY